ncbi:major facilitator superfamily permease [Klebsiella michiganensis]|nr:major facilitator superfamily permease [Klebsiella michiganensis]
MNITSNSTPKDIPRQRWLRIIPPILITCIISYMDRVNIAFAMPGGMDADLGISATMAGLAGGIFFIGYLFLQVPGGKIAVHGSGKKFIGWSLVAWAVISVLTGVNYQSVPASGPALLTRRGGRRHAAGRSHHDQ